MSDFNQDKSRIKPSDCTKLDNNLFVVGIGASAGGLNALEELFDHLPSDSGAAFVVIQHLSPDFKSLMKELLERHTKMSIYRVTEGMELQKDSVYLIPPGKTLVLEANLLRLKERKKDKNDKPQFNFPIDLFFTSLAKSYGERAFGVILSGSGSDGSYGLRAINEAGGIALVQDPKTAEFDGMPLSAISTGVVNQVLPPKELAELISECLSSPKDFSSAESADKGFVDHSNIQKVIKLLLETEHIDFSYYKVSTMSRRIHRRRLINSFQDITDYINFLDSSVEERNTLCSDLLINVTRFFRDKQAWINIENNILPILIEQAKLNEELRFWVAGCSTGEEAYSLAILIHEALKDTNKSLKVKIFATDIDRIALEKASLGVYPQSIVNDITTERLQKYFLFRDDTYQVMRKLREMLIFSPHDLSKDASFTRMHLITCRNVLIYMQLDLQNQVIRNFHFSLQNKGMLFLGEAESVGEFASEFTSLDKKWNIFQKRRNIRLPLPTKNILRVANSVLTRPTKLQVESQLDAKSTQKNILQRIAKESDSVVLVVDRDNRLLHVYGDASKVIKPLYGEIVIEVTKMVVLPLQLPLNTALHRVRKENKSVMYTDIKLEQGEERYSLSLKVIPPESNEESGDFFIVQIEQKIISSSPKVSEAEKFQISDETQKRILDLEHELQCTRENLQALIEELETTNEEQQASNEELTASNEELQSTNEELHSVNEELHTVNIEYQFKIQELTQLNNDIDNLLKSTDIGVIFLDPELKIRKFTPAATKAVFLRSTDLERPLTELTLKIECPQLSELLAKILQDQQPIELEVKQKDCNSYLLMQIHSYKTEDGQHDGLVISFVKIDEIKQVQQRLEQEISARKHTEEELRLNQEQLIISQQRAESIFNSMFQFIGVLTPEGILLEANQTALDFGGLASEEVINKPFWQAKWWTISTDTQQQLQDAIALAAQGEFIRYEVDVLGAEDRVATIDFSIKPVTNETGETILLIPEGRDISELKQAREQLQQTNSELEQRVVQRTQTLASFSDKLKQLHRLATTNYERIDNLFADYISTGCDIFDLSTGIVSQVEDCVYKILAVQSPLALSVGFETPCQDTYCAEVVEKQKTVTYARVGQIPEMQNHPVYLNFKLESFIGTPIFVNGVLYGTLNFSSISPRNLEFEPYEREIIELMARDIGKSMATLQAEKALKESEQRFRNTFEQAAIGIAHVSPEGRFIKVNQRLSEMLGYSSDRLSELTFQEITHPEDLNLDLKYVEQMLTGEIDTYSMEKRYFHQNGSIVWINLTVSLVKNDLGQPEYFIAAIEDISSRNQLQQANQAKDSFIAHMSHELRTPLNSILGFSSILQKELSLTSEQLHSVDIIYQSGQHLLTLINDILDFSKIRAKKLKLEASEFDLIQLLDEIASIFYLSTRQKGLTFSLDISSSVPVAVNADKTRLRQVLLNLLSNAVKFTDTGSVALKIGDVEEFDTTETEDIESQTERTTNNQNCATKKIRFQVEDTGKGVPQTKLADIFAPFEQLKDRTENEKGTGLGLTISQDIIQLMGGQIYLESEVSQGSRFWFDIELSEIEENLLPTSPDKIFATNKKLSVSCKVLVVDDYEDNRSLLISYLQPLGFELTEASNGREGLEIAKTLKPDVILVDLAMPVMDGKEMITRVKQQPGLQNIVIIAISANTEFILESSEFDCHGFLSKPVSSEQLLELIENHLRLDWQWNEPTVEPDESSIITAPSQEYLVRLLELVQIGDLAAIDLQMKSLETSDLQYISFAQKVSQLAVNFQQLRLEQFLQEFLHN